jgi:catechol 2,3-dioxygenase-like lactoylglutathione lyase family enzyme
MNYFESILQINFYVNDIEASIKWYEDVLGLKLEEMCGPDTAILRFRKDNQNSYDMGDIGEPIVCLIQRDKNTDINESQTHPVFRLNKDYKDRIYEELINKGVRLERIVHNKSHFAFFDIDGNKIELYLPGIYDQQEEQVKE